jgi:hypothetical protein
MTEPKISDHVWRPTYASHLNTVLCGFMNCRRPKAEHERAIRVQKRWPEQRSGEPS